MTGRPFTILGIDTDEDKATLAAGIKKHGLTWPIIHDGSPDEGISHKWYIRGYPTVYYVDHEGVIRRGEPLEVLVKNSEEALKKKP